MTIDKKIKLWNKEMSARHTNDLRIINYTLWNYPNCLMDDYLKWKELELECKLKALSELIIKEVNLTINL